MKAYVTFVLITVLGAYALDVHLMTSYKPSVALLERTTVVKGKLYLVGHRGGWTPEVNGIPLLCAVDFIGANSDCRERVAGLHSGDELTVAMARVPAVASNGLVAMSIAVNGAQIYSTSPQAVIDEYTRSSRRRLLHLPFFILFVLVLVRILY